MESTVGHKQIRIKSFTGKSEDWMDWKAKFQAVLHIEKLRKALTQTRPTDNETLIAAWEVNNEKHFTTSLCFARRVLRPAWSRHPNLLRLLMGKEPGRPWYRGMRRMMGTSDWLHFRVS